MGKYLLQASYTQSGLQGLEREGGTGRRKALAEAIEGVGGSLESMYYAFGGTDLYITADLPSETAAAALSLEIGAVGAIRVQITILITPEMVDDAIAMDVPYRPPGS